MKLILKLAILFTVIFTVPTLLIRSQPFYDRAASVLMYDQNCTLPCFVRIHPGSTSMEQAVQLMGSHDWIANRADEIPSPIRNAIFYGSLVPKTIFEWRWSDLLPDWIDGDQQGSMIFEDSGVFDLTIGTRLRLGEILLAFGQPDVASYVASSGQSGRRFEFTGWYTDEGMLVISTGRCPLLGYYDLPVRIRFRSNPPNLNVTESKFTVCRAPSP